MEIVVDKSMAESIASDFAVFGPVHLDVTDGERSLRHWRDLIGLELLAERDAELVLGAGDRELLVLHPGATAPLPREYSGLYHFALHLPSLGEFARVVARLAASGYHHYPTDHLTHFADYVDDPDGNGLEFVFETPERFGSVAVGPDGPELLDAEGRPRSGRDPIDLDWVLSHLPNQDLHAGLPAGTIVGHIHLRAADLPESLAYYRDLIGFTTNMDGSGMGMFDMSAGGTFPHRLACNNWESAGRGQRPAGASGLRYFTLELRRPEEIAAIVARLESAGRPVEWQGDDAVAIDPSGTRLVLTAAEAAMIG